MDIQTGKQLMIDFYYDLGKRKVGRDGFINKNI